MDILKLVGIFALILGAIAWQAVPLQLIRRKQRQIPQKTTSEIKALFQGQPKVFLVGSAIEELKARGEDISFTLPTILDMALSQSTVKSVFGRGLLKIHFAQKLPHIDLSEQKFSKPTLEKLKELREQIRTLTAE